MSWVNLNFQTKHVSSESRLGKTCAPHVISNARSVLARTYICMHIERERLGERNRHHCTTIPHRHIQARRWLFAFVYRSGEKPSFMLSEVGVDAGEGCLWRREGLRLTAAMCYMLRYSSSTYRYTRFCVCWSWCLLYIHSCTNMGTRGPLSTCVYWKCTCTDV